jgi:type VI secretion system protein ImpH
MSSSSNEVRELFDALGQELHGFGFYQLLRLLECSFPDSPRIGRSKRPQQDAIRLGQKPSLAFASSSFGGFRHRDGLPPLLTVTFFGLYGANGPLPHHLTEYVHDRMRRGDTTLAGFADIFHHRLLSLFYRAWADTQPTVQFDRPESDRFSMYVASTFGIGQETLRERDILPDRAKLQFAGLLSQQSRSAEGLAAILAAFFEMPVMVEEFVGQWIPIPVQERWRLGESPLTGSLGDTTIVGERIFDRQLKFRVVVGPVSFEQYQSMMPESVSFVRLTAMVLNYVGLELLFDVQLVLDRTEVPPLRLDGSVPLGLCSWATSRTMDRDPGDLIVGVMDEEPAWAEDSLQPVPITMNA